MKKKINVLHIISGMEDGGAQRIVLNYLQDFRYYDEFNIKILSLSNNYSSLYKSEIENNKDKFHFLKLNSECHGITKKIFDFVKINKEINSYLDKNAVDIVHIHLFGTLMLSINTIKKRKIPLKFYTLHSNPLNFKGKRLAILRYAFKACHVIPICVTNEQAKIAKEYYRFNNYEVVHNGIDFNKISNKLISKEHSRKKFSLAKDDFVICAVGRLNKIKRYDFLIEIFQNIIMRNPNSKLMIAGDGEELNNLKELVKDKKLDDNVRFLGNIENVVELYCASDVLAITSQSESSSLVLLEAQVCNIKCVISSGTPSESIITDRVIKMNDNASIDEWSKAILNGNNYLKKQYDFCDYDINKMSLKMKNIYLYYWRNFKNDE